ncbi:Mariner Mos1 transposase [Araneus ventricosus]|uniref:Mariner Mos1 transposase n=1 Tax=Araneus ventricosus TaxID=182803 RepID=A0A4Y2RHH6_ARAVE|nr:Mariner Mos1 transposase [Araneus ventricosus]
MIFLKRIVTGDETWICYETPETKRQSLEWQHTGSPKTKKGKPPLSLKKIMFAVFCDCQGILRVDWMERGTTINVTTYCETLKKLRRSIQNKRRGLLDSGIVFVHDNVRRHTARVTTTLLDSFRCEQFCRPPYNTDLAPSDFHLFSHLKKFLACQQFASDDEINENVQN